MNELQKNIIATICYYDVLDYPLTSFEVWRHMIADDNAKKKVSSTLGEVIRMLGNTSLDHLIAQKNGFYFLHDRENLVAERMRRNRISINKLRRLRHFANIMRYMPFVRAILVTGRLAMQQADQESDLDVLVILSGGHIWTGRAVITALLQILGVRKHGTKHRDHVCLNYYITDKALTVPTQDRFAAHEYGWTFPLFGWKTFQEFQRANMWMQKYTPQFCVTDIPHGYCMQDHSISQSSRTIGEFLLKLPFFENKMRSLQKKKIDMNPKTHLKDANIIANDHHLVFLPKPHSPRVEQAYQERKMIITEGIL